MKKVLSVLAVCLLLYPVYAQNPDLELSFTAIVDDSYVMQDRVLVRNISKDCDSMLI